MGFANRGAQSSGGAALALGLFTGGTKLVFATAAGANNNVNFGGAFPAASVGRVDVNTGAGIANITGIVAPSVDGQGLLIRNTGANSLTLNSQNAGSTAANQLVFSSDLILNQNDTIILVYDLALALWVISE